MEEVEHSIIAMQVGKDKYIASYCSLYGSIDYNGFILENFYDTKEKVQELLELGDLETLGKTANNCFSVHNKDNIYFPCLDNNSTIMHQMLLPQVVTYEQLINEIHSPYLENLYVYRNDSAEGQWYFKYKDNNEVLLKEELNEVIPSYNKNKTSMFIFKSTNDYVTQKIINLPISKEKLLEEYNSLEPKTNLEFLPNNIDFLLCSTPFKCLDIAKDEFDYKEARYSYNQFFKLNATVKALEDSEYGLDKTYTNLIDSYVEKDTNILNVITYLEKLNIPKLSEEEQYAVINSYNKQINLEFQNKKIKKSKSNDLER